MPRKSRNLQLIEDTDSQSFKIVCRDGHEFSKTGKWLTKNLTLACPECGTPVVHTYDDLMAIFSNRVRELEKLAEEGNIHIVGKY